MALLPEQVTRLKVEIAVEDRQIDQGFRRYLGASIIGHECPRYLWYNFRLCAKRIITPRQQRLFSRGHREENIVIADLIEAGMQVHSMQTGVIAVNGHVRGHKDGIVENVPDAPKTPHLLEVKTANDKNFAMVKRHGVKKFNIVYWVQSQIYMHLDKLTRALFVVANKNTDERYYERVRVSPEDAEFYLNRSADIIAAPQPLPRMGDADYFACKWCDYYAICHMNRPIHKSCRTCHKVQMQDGGKWRCSLDGKNIKFKKQIKGCKHYKAII